MQKRLMMLIVLIFSLFYVSVCFSERVYTPMTKIAKFQVYVDYGSGDVVFWTEQNATGCDYYWLNPDDPGFNTSVSAILSALHAKSHVQVYGYNDPANRWSGSQSNVCRFALISVY